MSWASPDQVYNANETGLNWRQLPTKTFVTHDELHPPGRKLPKEWLTLMPCSNASGNHKLKLLVVQNKKNTSIQTHKNGIFASVIQVNDVHG